MIVRSPRHLILRGINLGNALEAPKPGEWGVTITREMIRNIQRAGFNAIRVPVRFSAHTGPAPDYSIDEDFLKIVDEVISWGLGAGLTVILDLHHFDDLNQAPAAQRDRYLAIWSQLAGRYQDLPARLYFELLNEPNNNLDADTWNSLISESLAVIRETNPNRLVIISGIDFSTIDSLSLLDLPPDPHIMASFHFYEPFQFTHQGADWVSGSLDWVGTDWMGTTAEKNAIQISFDQAEAWSAQTGIPVIMGEFGVIRLADPVSRLRWISFINQQIELRHISWFYWELCSNFGIYDCQSGIWDENILHTLIHGE